MNCWGTLILISVKGMPVFAGVSLMVLAAGCEVTMDGGFEGGADSSTKYLKAENAPVETLRTVAAPTDPENDLARFMAGLDGGSGAPFNGLRRMMEWEDHRRRMMSLWQSHEDFRGREIGLWAGTQISDLRAHGTVFYPFSGPDFLFADAFFPNSRRVILVGLEGCDAMPDLRSLSTGEVIAGLNGTYLALENVLQYGYFQTKIMRSSLGRTKFRGVLPVIYTFLARTGHTIDSVQPIGLHGNGGVYPRGSGKHPAPGILVRCRSQWGTRKEIYYFQEDLSDGNLRSDQRILLFVQSKGAPVTYLKSASYLLHGSSFDTIRNFILGNSVAVVQDPSGIPFRYFQTADWRVSLYGYYTGPLDIFSKFYQEELSIAYNSGRYAVGTIEFGAGYKINKGDGALIVARRARR